MKKFYKLLIIFLLIILCNTKTIRWSLIKTYNYNHAGVSNIPIADDVGRNDINLVLLQHESDCAQEAPLLSCVHAELSIIPANVQHYIPNCERLDSYRRPRCRRRRNQIHCIIIWIMLIINGIMILISYECLPWVIGMPRRVRVHRWLIIPIIRGHRLEPLLFQFL